MTAPNEPVEFSNRVLLDTESRFEIERQSGRIENDAKVEVSDMIIRAFKTVLRGIFSVLLIAIGLDQYNRMNGVSQQPMVTEHVLFVFIAASAILGGLIFLAFPRLNMFSKKLETGRVRR